MKYRCLVMDHDDTVVNSTATIHYPCFVEYTKDRFPLARYTLEEYFLYNFNPGVVKFFREMVGMSEEQMIHEQKYWFDYVQRHVPKAYPGMRELLRRQKEEGGILCVVSHSYAENIRRDWRENGFPEPDLVYGWEYPKEQRKPSPFPIEDILRKTGLTRRDLLMVDDLKPGLDMSRAAGISFAAAGWANDIEPIERFMRASGDYYFKTVESLYTFLFDRQGNHHE